jgi:hypothetical protein
VRLMPLTVVRYYGPVGEADEEAAPEAGQPQPDAPADPPADPAMRARNSWKTASTEGRKLAKMSLFRKKCADRNQAD